MRFPFLVLLSGLKRLCTLRYRYRGIAPVDKTYVRYQERSENKPHAREEMEGGGKFGLERKRGDGLEFPCLCKVGVVLLGPPNVAPTRKAARKISSWYDFNLKIKIC